MGKYFDGFLRLTVIIVSGIILVMFLINLRINRSRSIDFQVELIQKKTNEQVRSELPKNKTAISGGSFRVARVLDGDTIVLDNGETVRLIGVDAPETHHPEIPVQRFAEESAEYLKRLVEGFECTLELEEGNLRDPYGRLLAYVFVDGRNINAEMIRKGYAYAYRIFSYSRREDFIALEHEAREHQRGLWHITLKDGRMASLIERYESLSIEGKKRLDEILDDLISKYPSEEGEESVY
jgi:endonuclease YncB( thermonuclease family)